jgi:very-short-patch-repair endonuclease
MREVNLDLLTSKINKNLRGLDDIQLQWFSTAIKLSDSPLECLLASALAGRKHLPVAQHEVDQFRLDFAFVNASLAIECDGWQFHKRRWLEDRCRDRLLLRSGWRVLRFAGAEIWKDAGACAEEIEDVYLALSK